MKQETVSQPEIKLIGLSARTNNKNEMNPATSKIGVLANRYWSQNIAGQIPNRKNPGVTITAYADYETDEHGDYTFYIGEAVTSLTDVPAGFQSLTIPAGRYRKITTESGEKLKVVVKAWQAIWSMSNAELGGARSYQADFEVYDQRASDPQNTVVDIYIGIK